MNARSAAGFRVHSGWAALVVVGGSLRAPAVLHRRRIELVEQEVPKQPYHAAESMPLKAAERLIRCSEVTALRLAEAAIGDLLKEQRDVRGCVILLASARPTSTLEATLASHAMIHAAEGELFRVALARAGEGCGLAVMGIHEKELVDRAVRALRIGPGALEARIMELGRGLGPPWTQDQKRAALAAWLALSEVI